jgi:pilus assembly protein FimV
MAYGRDSQAEEILNDALKADPKRGAIYVKLLEIYEQRQDLAQFEATASELYSRTQGQGRDWEKALQMGRRLDPSNPFYSGKASGAQEGAPALQGLEPVVEEPSRLDLSADELSGGPRTLSNMDFGTSPTPAPDAYPGQLKDTVAIRGKVDDLLATRVIEDEAVVRPEAAPITAGNKNIDFRAREAKPAPAAEASSSVDFDLDQAIKAPAGAPRKNVAGTASRQASAGKSGELAAPLEFDLPGGGKKANANGTGNGFDMSGTVVLPSVQGGSERSDAMTLDLEKTSFDPHALDFDLDLGASASPKGNPVASRGRATASVRGNAPAMSAAARPAPAPNDDVSGENEIDTKLELAHAYEDMGDTEGALELLREVVVEGNATQKASAQALIDKLS